MNEPCIPCQAKNKSADKQRIEAERKIIIERINRSPQNENIKTIAIVETKSGKLSTRERGEDGYSRLPIVEYILKLQGVAAE